MKKRTYGRVDWCPKYLPDTMVEIQVEDSTRMVRYEDLDEKFEWIEITSMGDSHPVFTKGMHWGDTEV